MKKLLGNQKGQGIMEYVIISSLIGFACLVAIGGLGKNINTKIKEMKTSVSNQIKIPNNGR